MNQNTMSTPGPDDGWPHPPLDATHDAAAGVEENYRHVGYESALPGLQASASAEGSGDGAWA